ncbi:MAG: helix-turn-helix transcriptional regulator [Elusimicrobia bacterium]|nr:helix-turn-helix transcriptional regulator [Elusimicrobiota bacterium]
MKQEKISLSKKIKQAMLDAELTQQKLARIIKTDQGLISAWQLGKRIPTIRSLEKIAKATNKPVDFFICKENAVSCDDKNEITKLKEDLKLRDELIKFLRIENEKQKTEIKNLKEKIKSINK